LGIYSFIPCKPGAFHYQIDLLENDNQKEKEFLELMEETEVEIVDRWSRWVYLRRAAELGDFELYTDNASKAMEYERLGKFYIFIMLIELLFYSSAINSVVNKSAFKIFFSILIIFFVIILAILIIKCFSKSKVLRKEL
jgi:hypothetical protein